MHELTILNSGSVNAPVNAGNEAYIAGSASGNIDSTDILIYRYRLIGTVTLTGASSIAYSGVGSPAKNEEYEFNYEASVTPAGNTFSIFGVAVPDELLSSKFTAKCVYDGSAWKVKLLPSFDGVGIVDSDRLAASSVTTAKIEDNAVTLAKMAGLAKGKIIYGDASGNPADIELGSADGRMLLGDTSAGVAAVDMSGDATISKTGALTIAAGVIEGDAAASAGDRNIAAATIEPSNLTAGARKDSFSIRLDFDDASKLGGQIFLPVCYNCTVNAVKATLVGAAGSDLTVIIKDAGGTVMTGSQIDVPSATVVGNVITSTVTGNNTMTGGTNMILEPSAAGTLAGHLHLTFCVTRDN